MIEKLIHYEDSQYITDSIIEYKDVIFINNFGIFFKGDKFPSLDIFLEEGEIIAYDLEGNSIKSQKFELTPIFNEKVIVPEILL